jgi:hypothetical protein
MAFHTQHPHREGVTIILLRDSRPGRKPGVHSRLIHTALGALPQAGRSAPRMPGEFPSRKRFGRALHTGHGPTSRVNGPPQSQDLTSPKAMQEASQRSSAHSSRAKVFGSVQGVGLQQGKLGAQGSEPHDPVRLSFGPSGVDAGTIFDSFARSSGPYRPLRTMEPCLRVPSQYQSSEQDVFPLHWWKHPDPWSWWNHHGRHSEVTSPVPGLAAREESDRPGIVPD